MDRGDVLQAQNISSTNRVRGIGAGSGWGMAGWGSGIRDNPEVYSYMAPYFTPLSDDNISSGTHQSSAGITDGKGTKFTTPIDSILTFHSGKPDQEADSTLVSNAANFKIEQITILDPKITGAFSRLLDTAYCVVKYTIGEGETTIPALDFAVR